MLGVGGARRNLGRKALRGSHPSGHIGGGLDPRAQKRELLRKLQEKRAGAEARTEPGTGTEGEGTTGETS
ncbi:DUF6243 family protein [Streptomyces adelaidensis]|uniref:DUF6243 family protein n=1 Tax=Streptomyces adelaidensis TaxID=2796465 RepID=UPI00190379E7